MLHAIPWVRDVTMPTNQSKILGRWRITEMEQWDAGYLNMEVEAFIEFGGDGIGSFQFGLVQGQVDYERTGKSGKEEVEWTWEGMDEMDPVSGRGRAELQPDGRLQGRFFFHGGDSSDFTAKRIKNKVLG